MYARRHEDTWSYVIVYGVALWTRGVLVAGMFLDEDVRHVLGVEIPKFGERISHGMTWERPRRFLIIPIGTHASSTHWHHMQLKGGLLCSIQTHNVDSRTWGIFLRRRNEI